MRRSARSEHCDRPRSRGPPLPVFAAPLAWPRRRQTLHASLMSPAIPTDFPPHSQTGGYVKRIATGLFTATLLASMCQGVAHASLLGAPVGAVTTPIVVNGTDHTPPAIVTVTGPILSVSDVSALVQETIKSLTVFCAGQEEGSETGCLETILKDAKDFLKFELTDLKKFTLDVLHLTLQGVCIQVGQSDPLSVTLPGSIVVGCL